MGWLKKKALRLSFWFFFFFFFCDHSGAQMEVDYTEKLNFSDDEENQSTKDKVDNW